jgi:hypothetical protein
VTFKHLPTKRDGLAKKPVDFLPSLTLFSIQNKKSQIYFCEKKVIKALKEGHAKQ